MTTWEAVVHSGDQNGKRHISHWSKWGRSIMCGRFGQWRVAGPEDDSKPYCLDCLRIARTWVRQLTAHIDAAEAVNREREQ